MSFAPYEPPKFTRDARPRVIAWYRAYAAFMAIAALVGTVVAGLSHGHFTAVFSGALAALFGVAAFVPFKPWGWTMGLLAIGLGVAGITIIVTVPLLVLWFQPTVKAAFARL